MIATRASPGGYIQTGETGCVKGFVNAANISMAATSNGCLVISSVAVQEQLSVSTNKTTNRVTHVVAEYILLKSNSKFHCRPGSQDIPIAS